MGPAASIRIRIGSCTSSAVCPAVGLAAGVFGAGMAVGAAAATCPPVGIAAVFGAGVALGAALRVKQATPHAVATDFDALVAVASAASEAATGYLRAVKNAACSVFEGAKRLGRSACHGARKVVGTERSYAVDKEEAAPAAKREREMDMDHRARAAQAQHAGPDFLTALSEAAAWFHVAGGAGPGGNANVPWDSPAVFSASASGALDPWASQLLATRAAWRASEAMAVLETLKPLEKLGANIPPEAKSCICVIAAAAGVCLDVFKPPPKWPCLGRQWSAHTRRGSRTAVPWPRYQESAVQ